jgi:hypothetical protein
MANMTADIRYHGGCRGLTQRFLFRRETALTMRVVVRFPSKADMVRDNVDVR